MQIIESKGNIVEKILRDSNGNLVRAKFYVYECAGRVKARLVGVTYLEETTGIASPNFSLPGHKKTKLLWSEFFGEDDFSPAFITSDILYSSGSKPRAPTF